MIVIVGAGLAGLTIAERLKTFGFHDIIIYEKRNEIGGNCFDYYNNEAKTYVHKYGPHLFHTNNKEVWSYINKFGRFISVRHKIVIETYNGYFYLPLNLNNIDEFYKKGISKYILSKYGKNKIIYLPQLKDDLKTQELAQKIYNTVYLKYSRKQWGNFFEELQQMIYERVPALHTFDNQWYFQDKYQGLPKKGYFNLFKNMSKGFIIEHKNFTFDDFVSKHRLDLVIYTGPIDSFFGNILGKLDYIGLDFECKTERKSKFKILNMPMDPTYTRYVDYGNLYNSKEEKTIKIYEIPYINDYSEYYPVLTKRNLKLYEKYKDFANRYFPNIIFCGRLGNYKYYNMDQIIVDSFKISDDICRNYCEHSLLKYKMKKKII
jgi:UDP-galactopyranose mutase